MPAAEPVPVDPIRTHPGGAGGAGCLAARPVPTAGAPRPDPAVRRPPDRRDAPLYGDLLEAVRISGRYLTTAEAERTTASVLSAFTGQLTGDVRVAFLRSLPLEAEDSVLRGIRNEPRRTARAFVDSVAARTEGATHATARWDISTVLTAVATRMGDELVRRVLRALPPGYALLFGRAELAPMA